MTQNFKLRPVYGRIIVKKQESADVTPGGIVIPKGAKEAPLEAQVVAVAPVRSGKTGGLSDSLIAVGDFVMFSKYAGSDFTVDGEKYMALDEKEVLVYWRSDEQ